jgi:putative glycosyltransferase (TIGR04348 family)
MLALHARRSATSIAAWAKAHTPLQPKNIASPGLAVVLTGTDLYRDIHEDAQSAYSLALAQRLVLLQECGPQALPAALRERAVVMFQSTSERNTLAKTQRHLRVVMVGHLREEKTPETLMNAARLIAPSEGILIDHIGAPLDPALGQLALATAADCPHYRWLGSLSHAQTRRRIQQAHALVHTSRMEGGAHVVMEAVCSGTPVIASDIDGNRGMLGANYAGYFEWNNATELAQLLRQDKASLGDQAGLLQTLQAQSQQRAALFAPQAEQATLLKLVADLLNTSSDTIS